MKDRHIITQAELDEWLRRPQWQIFASSVSGVSCKKLEVDGAAPNTVFRVTDREETRFLGTDKVAAVAAYNAAD